MERLRQLAILIVLGIGALAIVARVIAFGLVIAALLVLYGLATATGMVSPDRLIRDAGRYADRLSINVEIPMQDGLRARVRIGLEARHFRQLLRDHAGECIFIQCCPSVRAWFPA